MVINDLWKYYGDELILQDISAAIGTSDRIGLVGANGVGKTTLLRVLVGEERADRGTISHAKGYTVGYLAQENTSGQLDQDLETYLTTPFQEVLDMADQMRKLENDLATPEIYEDEGRLEQKMQTYAHIQQQFELLGGYNFRVQIKSAALGLGFSEQDFTRKLNTFSGGERMRAALAHLLLSQPALLLLDEPTNHLDVDAVEWLENYLSTYPKALLVVSHDRYFLDRIANKIWELHDTRLYQYRGNYSTYLPQREQLMRQLQETAEKQEQEKQRIEAFIRKFGAGTRARQAKSLEKKLKRMEDVTTLSEDPTLRFRFEPERQSGTKIVTLDHIKKNYELDEVLRGVNGSIKRGDRIGLIGPNGSGKSTLLKILVGELDFVGKMQWGVNVDIGYFSQDIVFDGQKTVLEELYEEHRLDLGELRSVLARFLFRGEDVFKSTSVLSGGEKNRLALSKLLLSGANFLILDEPTNHLDIYSREALEIALCDFNGTILFVSHDRYFIDKLASKLWILEEGIVTEFHGNFTAYREAQRRIKALENESIKQEQEKQKKLASASRGPSRHLMEKERQSLEEEIIELETKKEELEGVMASPELYQDEERSKEAVNQYQAIEDQLRRCYQRWETLVEELKEG